MDEAAGLFLVVDGMGGHAAGEHAAGIAIEVIGREVALRKGAPETRIRGAIAAANNEIYRVAQLHEEWQGMACVLTLVLAQEDRITVGHVGDSRLYLAWTGGLRKLTSDHSPVGELEDRGEITELEAMRDPRRNQVFRDIGSRPGQTAAEEFIEVKTFPFRSDAAFLLCTDGLSDALTNGEINAIVQRFDGDAQRTAADLVEAANQAGGRDNVTVIFIAGPEFTGTGSHASAVARTRHSITRMKKHHGPWATALSRFLWLAAGAALGISGLLSSERLIPRPAERPSSPSKHILVDPADPHSLVAALENAHPGDVVDVPQGSYDGPLELRDGIDVISVSPGETVIRAGGPSSPDPGIAVAARGVKFARFAGFRLEGTAAQPLSAGVLLDNSSIEINDIEVTGAGSCAVRFSGASAGALRAGYFRGNACNILVEGESSPRIGGNRLLGPPIEVRAPAHPVLANNTLEAASSPERK